ncbi:hypothetical protein JQ604_24065 [Bradyrhizobium jicamae]|uniref:hypothetical protein n=1 Tax=Bradyrhizobium jicamae TaxID=280332 RepID=UPI001BA88F25|nr:hypothetical protein [Bradyrhizobium jicamae]MBR0755271.1 hypothetical protein [Bradyrhizobium jicamae]
MVRERDNIDRRKILLNANWRVQVEAEPLAEGKRKAVGTALATHDTGVLKTTLAVMADLHDAARATIRELQVNSPVPVDDRFLEGLTGMAPVEPHNSTPTDITRSGAPALVIGRIGLRSPTGACPCERCGARYRSL